MAGYIGSKASVTQVDGYNRAEADAEFVDVTGDTMTGALNVPTLVAGANGAYAIFMKDATNTARPHLATSGNDTYIYQVGSGDLAWRNQADSLTLMKLDAAGRVTMPYQPLFQLGGGSNSTVSIAANAVIGNWNPITNVGGHWNNSTNRFTAPVAGKYFFRLELDVRTASSNWAIAGMTLNGGFVHGGGDVIVSSVSIVTANNPHTLTASIIVSMSANDYVQFSNRNNDITSYVGHTSALGYLIG